MLNYYDARLGASRYGGMFNPDTHKPYLNYYAFMMFNQAYKLKNEIQTTSDSDKVFVCGAKDDKKKVLILSNLDSKSVVTEFDLQGVSTDDVEILMINDTYHYSPTGKTIENNLLEIPAHSCVEIRFY